jgi:hypothetical protein
MYDARDTQKGFDGLAAIQAHLEICAPCRAEIALQRLIAEALRVMPTPIASPEMAARTRAALRRTTREPADRYVVVVEERCGGDYRVSYRSESRVDAWSAPVPAPPIDRDCLVTIAYA